MQCHHHNLILYQHSSPCSPAQTLDYIISCDWYYNNDITLISELLMNASYVLEGHILVEHIVECLWDLTTCTVNIIASSSRMYTCVHGPSRTVMSEEDVYTVTSNWNWKRHQSGISSLNFNGILYSTSANIIVLGQLEQRWLQSKVIIIILSLSVIAGWDAVTSSFF